MLTVVLSAALTVIDFGGQGAQWHGNKYVQECRPQADGLSVRYEGVDPWIYGPSSTFPLDPAAKRMRLTLLADSEEADSVRLYYHPEKKEYNEEMAVTLLPESERPGAYSAIIPPISGTIWCRFDPPGGAKGSLLFKKLLAEPIVPIATPSFETPQWHELSPQSLTVQAGEWRLTHDPKRWNAFTLTYRGKKLAEAAGEETWIANVNGKPQKLTFVTTSVSPLLVPVDGTNVMVKGGISAVAELKDAQGVMWRTSRYFKTTERGDLVIGQSVVVSADRELLHLPLITLFCGRGTFGEHKTQALLPGCEYLADEPSSNELEIHGANANRHLVPRYKLCYPLVGLAVDGVWFSVEQRTSMLPTSPIFDSPDRLFRSGGHLLGFWVPAADDKIRFDGEADVYGGITLKKDIVYMSEMILSSGEGDTVVPMMQGYVARNGLPNLPKTDGGFDGAIRLMAEGWLDSCCREGTKWRHASGSSNFQPRIAEEVPLYLLWLAAHTKDVALRERLEKTAGETIATFDPEWQADRRISHISSPANLLLYGNLEQRIRRAANGVRHVAQRAASGAIPYTPSKTDYSAGSGTNIFNGFTAMQMGGMTEDVTLTGDEGAISAYLAVLDKMLGRYRNEVPRGAQPWEMPLHTPDILASAHLIRAYLTGYWLTRDRKYLDEANYWAWTGMSMVYLTPPAEGEIGVYSTIGVMGSTGWTSPCWVGRPVQWCGLVYGAALFRLASAYDDENKLRWRQVAQGIQLTGLQMSYPRGDLLNRTGLLPDSVDPVRQLRYAPDINPGTVQAMLGEALGTTPLYTICPVGKGSLVHALGSVEEGASDANTISFRVTPWSKHPSRVIVTRVEKPEWVSDHPSFQYLPEARVLLLTVDHPQRIRIRLGKEK
ncbi:MAG: hypothetical protein IKR48_13320 [Kiritimatiellae bacterium]|nr:hypothetical protein [Kiritimatiellia bacterium]